MEGDSKELLPLPIFKEGMKVLQLIPDRFINEFTTKEKLQFIIGYLIHGLGFIIFGIIIQDILTR